MVIAALLIALSVIAAVAFEDRVIRHLRDQEDRIRDRLDRLTARLTAAAVPMPASGPANAPEPVPATVPSLAAEPAVMEASAGAVVREPAPDFLLTALDGRRVSRDDLLAAGKPAVLMVTDPRCGPCFDLLPDVRRWRNEHADRLSVALISTGEPEANHAMTDEYDLAGAVLLQREHEVERAYGMELLPAAVLLQPDGTRGEAVNGTFAIRAMVAAALGEALAAAQTQAIPAVRAGDQAPPLVRPDLDGTIVDLADFRGEPTLLLFWSPGCHHCQDLLPEIQSWSGRPGEPRLLVVSRGPIGLNKDAGIGAPVVIDHDRELAAMFGVTGTPAAVVIGSTGIVASNLARGTTAVRALADRWLTVTAMAAD